MIGAIAASILFLAAPFADATPAPTASPAAAATPSPRNVGGSLSLFGGDYTLAAGEVRDGTVTVYGGSVEIEGTVTQDLRVYGGSVDITGTVGHDVAVYGGSVHLHEHGVVGHDVTVVGGSFDRDEGARVGHDVKQEGGAGFLPSLPGILPLPVLPQFVPFGGLRGFDFGFGIVFSIGVVLLALLLQVLLPAQVATTRDALEDRPFASLGFGCLTAVAGVLVSLLLGITVLLLPVSVAIAVAMGLAWLLGLAGAIALIGSRLTAALHVRADPVPTLLLGGALVAVLVNVPILGGIFGLVIGSMAVGAVVLTRFGTRPHPPAPPPRGVQSGGQP